MSATLLSNLARRAAAARAKKPLLDDPLAIEAVERLDYDFTGISRGASWHALRVATFDGAARRFLKRHPDGTVVALGEGLETQFWRVDNGRMRWNATRQSSCGPGCSTSTNAQRSRRFQASHGFATCRLPSRSGSRRLPC
ncbi:MAG TPA: hypothetical protein VJP41_07805, partial [Gaiellaceae bacterium]|nr:hypothetical protein [Gaiellaceae bacterium]